VEASTNNRNNERRYQLTWNHRGEGWLNEFIFARDAAANGAIPNVTGPSSVVTFNGGATTPNVGDSRVLILGGTNFA
ncbi:hypothetical protein ABI003_15350, partial [Enterococcus faecium]